MTENIDSNQQFVCLKSALATYGREYLIVEPRDVFHLAWMWRHDGRVKSSAVLASRLEYAHWFSISSGRSAILAIVHMRVDTSCLDCRYDTTSESKSVSHSAALIGASFGQRLRWSGFGLRLRHTHTSS